MSSPEHAPPPAKKMRERTPLEIQIERINEKADGLAKEIESAERTIKLKETTRKSLNQHLRALEFLEEDIQYNAVISWNLFELDPDALQRFTDAGLKWVGGTVEATVDVTTSEWNGDPLEIIIDDTPNRIIGDVDKNISATNFMFYSEEMPVPLDSLTSPTVAKFHIKVWHVPTNKE